MNQYQFNDETVSPLDDMEFDKSAVIDELVELNVLQQLNDSVTFIVEMTLFAVWDANGNDVTKEYVEYQDRVIISEIKEKRVTVTSECQLELKRNSKISSAYYKMLDQDIEYKVQFDIPETYDDDNVEIFVEIKSLPSYIDRLCCFCMINIKELNIDISGIVHFRQTRLKDTLNDMIQFPPVNNTILKTVYIEMTAIKIYYNHPTIITSRNDVIMLIDDLLKIFAL